MRVSIQLEMHNKWLKYFAEMRMEVMPMQNNEAKDWGRLIKYHHQPMKFFIAISRQVPVIDEHCLRVKWCVST